MLPTYSYYLVTIVQKDMQLNRSTYEIIQISI